MLREHTCWLYACKGDEFQRAPPLKVAHARIVLLKLLAHTAVPAVCTYEQVVGDLTGALGPCKGGLSGSKVHRLEALLVVDTYPACALS